MQAKTTAFFLKREILTPAEQLITRSRRRRNHGEAVPNYAAVNAVIKRGRGSPLIKKKKRGFFFFEGGLGVSFFFFGIISAIFNSGCSTEKVITKTEFQKIEIPKELLTCRQIQRPRISNSNDILTAYSAAYLAWRDCKTKLTAINHLNSQPKN